MLQATTSSFPVQFPRKNWGSSQQKQKGVNGRNQKGVRNLDLVLGPPMQNAIRSGCQKTAPLLSSRSKHFPKIHGKGFFLRLRTRQPWRNQNHCMDSFPAVQFSVPQSGPKTRVAKKNGEHRAFSLGPCKMGPQDEPKMRKAVFTSVQQMTTEIKN